MTEIYGWYSTGGTTLPSGWNWTSGTGPAASPAAQVAALSRHVPWASQTCAHADRAADEQINWLLEELHKPCEHCGKNRTPPA